MRPIHVAPLLIVAFLSACGPQPVAGGPGAKPVVETLQGRWRVTACVVNGQPLAPSEIRTLHWTFTGHELAWSDGNKFNFTVDDTASPKSIDLRFPENSDPAETTRGIYAIDPGGPATLKVCISKTDTRPLVFNSPSGSRQYFYTLQRDNSQPAK